MAHRLFVSSVRLATGVGSVKNCMIRYRCSVCGDFWASSSREKEDNALCPICGTCLETYDTVRVLNEDEYLLLKRVQYQHNYKRKNGNNHKIVGKTKPMKTICRRTGCKRRRNSCTEV